MSETFLRVIPADPQWQPSQEGAVRAAEYVAGLYAGPDDEVGSVETDFHERVNLIDGGECMEEVFCPKCTEAIGLDWFWDLLSERGGGPAIDDLTATVPCCGAALTLPELRFEMPVGFARFAVSIRDGHRRSWEFSIEELAAVAEVLGHPVTQVHAHY